MLMELISDHAFSPRHNVNYMFLFYEYFHVNFPDELSSMVPDSMSLTELFVVVYHS